MRPFTFIRSRRAPERSGQTRAERRKTVLPWVAGAVVLLFRATSLRDLSNDHYMHLSWAQQVLFGELPGLDFIDPGMPLAWALSAVAQAIWPGPLSEAWLSAAMFGIAAGATAWIVIRLTGSWVSGATAAAVAAVLVPRLYNYPKLLVPALVMVLLQRYVERPSRDRLVAIGMGLAAAVLFRHDLGLYATVVTTIVLAIAHRDSPRLAARALFVTAAATAIALAPYLVYVQWSEGLVEHVRRGIEFSKGESHQLQYPWPTFPSLAPGGGSWSRLDATAFLYYGSWLLPLAAIASLRGTGRLGSGDRLPLALAATAFLSLYLPIIVRHPIDQRLPDLATPLAVVGLFVAHRAARGAFAASKSAGWVPPARVLATLGGWATVGVTLALLANAAILGGFARELEETRIARGPRGLVTKVRSLRQDTQVWPWERFWPHSGDFPPAVLYVRACTGPDDYVLLSWPSAEYYYFAQRKFASGLSMFFAPDGFATDRDQDFFLARLTRERPPIALINQTTRGEFRNAYPRVDDWIAAHYTIASTYAHYDGNEIAIGIRADLRPTTTFGAAAWPCGFVGGGPQASAARQ